MKYVLTIDDATGNISTVQLLGTDDNGQVLTKPIPLHELEPYDEDTVYQKGFEFGRNEVWDAVKNLLGSCCEAREIAFGAEDFCRTLFNLPAAEAISKIQAYEFKTPENRDGLRIGDVVEREGGSMPGIVYDLSEDHEGCLHVSWLYWFEGHPTTDSALAQYVKKAGGYFPQMGQIMQLLRWQCRFLSATGDVVLGDEVVYPSYLGEMKLIVFEMDDKNYYGVRTKPSFHQHEAFRDDGWTCVEKEKAAKTGLHFPQVAQIINTLNNRPKEEK